MARKSKNAMQQADDFQFLLNVGGKPVTRNLKAFALTPDQVEEWNFGLLTEEGPPVLQHTPETRAAQEEIRGALPDFALTGPPLAGAPDKVILSDVFRHPAVKRSLKKYLDSIPSKTEVFSQFHQLTGSCVGSGSGYCITIAAAVEVAYLNQPEEPVVFWWPYTYGRGRFKGGMTRPGEGSFSEAQAEAFLEGCLRADLADLPKFKDDGDGYVLTSSQEIQWSDGDSATVLPWLDKAKKNPFKTSAVIRNFDDARTCLVEAKMPFMFCGNWGGKMKCPVKGSGANAALLNSKSGVWNHNQTCFAYWDNPELGPLLGIMNQWGLRTHGDDPGGLPAGAYWIAKSDAEYQIRQGSCIVVSGFEGFPALDIDPWNW